MIVMFGKRATNGDGPAFDAAALAGIRTAAGGREAAADRGLGADRFTFADPQRRLFRSQSANPQRDRRSGESHGTRQAEFRSARQEIRKLVGEIVRRADARCRRRKKNTSSKTSATTCWASGRSNRCWRATTSPTSWFTAPANVHRGQRRNSGEQRALSRSRPVAQPLPAHRQPHGRRVDESSPICDARLPDGRASTSLCRRSRSMALR